MVFNRVLNQGARLPALLRQRLPLPLTMAAILALVLVPTALLQRWPRPQARGLERLLPVASLLQSFPADPSRAVPPLWQQRLGSGLAPEAWRRQRRLWWQFWGRHGEAGAFLALPASQLPRPPAHAIPLDDLVVVAPDPLSRQLLLEQLRLHQRRPRGLELRCLQRLQEPQGVYWTAVAVGTMAGPLAPLLQRVQQGCLTLSLQSAGLAWTGEAGATPGLLAPPPPASAVATLPPQTQPDGALLEIRGGSLAALLQGLTNRSFIREPLERRYGVQASQLNQLSRSPFALRLRSQPQGAFKASLELLIDVSGQRQRWSALLKPLAEALLAQGLEALPPAGGSPRSDLLASATWKRSDGTVVGGWRWLLAPQGQGEPQLLFFLGPRPGDRAAAVRAAGGTRPAEVRGAPLGPRDLVLLMRPGLLRERGLLPRELPEPVQRADALTLALQGNGVEAPQEGVSRVTGALHLNR
jgi:hypothetical protein